MAGGNGYVRQILRKIEKHESLAGVDLRNLIFLEWISPIWTLEEPILGVAA